MEPRDDKRYQKSKRPHAKSNLRNPLKRPKSEFKRSKHEQPASVLFQDQDDEPEFPRGGGRVLSREEVAEARAEAEEEFEREQGLTSRGRKKQKKKATVKSYKFGEDEWGSLFGQGITGKLPRLTNRITWKNISPGMKLWGVITEVNLKDLVISLPGGLRGFVHAEDASHVLAENGDKVSFLLPKTLHVGQLVSCVVMQVDDDKGDEKGRKRIRLSLRLSVLYKGLTLDVVQDGMVNARILFIDPSTRAVGLTLNPQLVHYKPPPMHVKTRDIYEKSCILRIDENFGLLLNIPSSPEHTPAYVLQFDVSDEEVLKLKKKQGDYARLRVLAIRHLEGLAIGTLKKPVRKMSLSRMGNLSEQLSRVASPLLSFPSDRRNSPFCETEQVQNGL